MQCYSFHLLSRRLFTSSWSLPSASVPPQTPFPSSRSLGLRLVAVESSFCLCGELAVSSLDGLDKVRALWSVLLNRCAVQHVSRGADSCMMELLSALAFTLRSWNGIASFSCLLFNLFKSHSFSQSFFHHFPSSISSRAPHRIQQSHHLLHTNSQSTPIPLAITSRRRIRRAVHNTRAIQTRIPSTQIRITIRAHRACRAIAVRLTAHAAVERKFAESDIRVRYTVVAEVLARAAAGPGAAGCAVGAGAGHEGGGDCADGDGGCGLDCGL